MNARKIEKQEGKKQEGIKKKIRVKTGRNPDRKADRKAGRKMLEHYVPSGFSFHNTFISKMNSH